MRSIGGKLARGGVARRSVPGGGVFFPFPMGAAVGNWNPVLQKYYPPLKIPPFWSCCGELREVRPQRFEGLVELLNLVQIELQDNLLSGGFPVVADG